jgi:hypothetical protein
MTSVGWHFTRHSALAGEYATVLMVPLGTLDSSLVEGQDMLAFFAWRNSIFPMLLCQ